jgi:hypothetical protein
MSFQCFLNTYRLITRTHRHCAGVEYAHVIAPWVCLHLQFCSTVSSFPPRYTPYHTMSVYVCVCVYVIPPWVLSAQFHPGTIQHT